MFLFFLGAAGEGNFVSPFKKKKKRGGAGSHKNQECGARLVTGMYTLQLYSPRQPGSCRLSSTLA